MKRLLLPLLAAIALPTAANAESVYLLVKTTTGNRHMPNALTRRHFFQARCK